MVRQLIKMGMVVGMAMGIVGCSEMPVVSDAKAVGHDSLWAQEAWVQGQAEDALAVLGPVEGWWVDVPELQWPSDKEKIIRGAETEICRSGPINRRPGRLNLTLSNRSFGDPAEAAKRLWAQWESEGWEVTYIIPPEEQKAGEIDFRADREDGAMLAFGGNAIYVEVEINSSCSDDLSVMERY
ncbi:hypothetical protein [Leucobacter sp. CX169]|nr:hypothetical protein [Leucobacter sp. CX169]